MKTSLWFLLVVEFYLHDKCVKSQDIPQGLQTTFQSVADFIKSFVAKSSNAASNIFNRQGGSDEKNTARTYKSFKHNAWEEGEAKYYATEKITSTAASHLTVPEVAQWHGYNIETHIVKTMDGYFLTTHRLTGVSNLRNRTVLLHHGLLGSSMDWILLRPGECMLPFILAEAGYDVWFMNARGNIYSRSHATLTLSMPEFWDFSFEEMGLMDIPAVINYIRKQNDVPIDFVTHSMGSTAFLVYLSSSSEYQKYIRTGVLIAPLAFMSNVTGPLGSVPDDTFERLTGEFLPHRKVPRKLAIKYCKGPIRLCRNPLFFLSGVPTKTIFTARVQDHVPAGGSVNTILHYMQLIKSGKFHSYKNKTHQYDLHSIDIPLALISSNNDQLAIVKNVQKIYRLIKYPIAHYIIRNKNVSHTELLWDKTASCVVFRKTLEYLVKGYKQDNNMTNNNIEKSTNKDNFVQNFKNKMRGNIDEMMDENKDADKYANISHNDIDINDNNDDDNDKNEDDNDSDKNNKDADSNDDDSDNVDNNNDKEKVEDDKKHEEVVEDDEEEVTDNANGKGSNKYIIQGNDLRKSENNNALKYLIEVKGDDIIIKKLNDTSDITEEKGDQSRNSHGINNLISVGKGEHTREDESLNKIEDKGEHIAKDSQNIVEAKIFNQREDTAEHKCVNAAGKGNKTCLGKNIDYGHIFYDGPDAFMDFQLT